MAEPSSLWRHLRLDASLIAGSDIRSSIDRLSIIVPPSCLRKSAKSDCAWDSWEMEQGVHRRGRSYLDVQTIREGLGQEPTAVVMPVQLPERVITPVELSQLQEYVAVAVKLVTSGASRVAAN